MAVKKIAYDQEARERMRDGVKQLARAVKVTLGPRGRNVIIEKSFGSPLVTKDGVTVAKEIELAGKYENLGAQLVKEVASKTSDIAGDGTTTATVLAEAIFEEGIKNVTANEPQFQGHFPGNPIMPGVLLIEGMAQTAGALCVHGRCAAGWPRSLRRPRAHRLRSPRGARRATR